MDTMQELVAALSTDLDTAGAEIQEVKRKLMKTIREKAILEARLRGDPELPLEYDSDESIEYLPEYDSDEPMEYLPVTSSQARPLWRAQLPHPLPLEMIGLAVKIGVYFFNRSSSKSLL
jgi:hypothetical protein